MAICSPLVGIPKDCGDNNLGAIKRALIGSFEDVANLTVTATAAPDTDGEVTAVTRTVGTKFEDFPLPKDTSMFSQEWTGDLVADTHSYTQTCELGFRRIDLRKRNAISLLAAGRRDLIAVVQDNNEDWWMLRKLTKVCDYQLTRQLLITHVQRATNARNIDLRK
jgi:hypothetical protein